MKNVQSDIWLHCSMYGYEIPEMQVYGFLKYNGVRLYEKNMDDKINTEMKGKRAEGKMEKMPGAVIETGEGD